jgi:hypothetical protein
MSGKVVVLNGKKFVVGTGKIKSTKIRTNKVKPVKVVRSKRDRGCIGRRPNRTSRKRRN